MSSQERRGVRQAVQMLQRGLSQAQGLAQRELAVFLERISDQLGPCVAVIPATLKESLLMEFQEKAGWHPKEKRVVRMPLRLQGILACLQGCLRLLGIEVEATAAVQIPPTTSGGGARSGSRPSYAPPGDGGGGGGGGGNWRSAMQPSSGGGGYGQGSTSGPIKIMQRGSSGGSGGGGGGGSARGRGTPNAERAAGGGQWKEALEAFFEQMIGAPEVVVAMGRHRHWTGKMHFFADGKFFVVKRGQSRKGDKMGFSKDSDKAGMWQLNAGKLQLVWFKWNSETLVQDGQQKHRLSSAQYKFEIDFGELEREWYGLSEQQYRQLMASGGGALSYASGAHGGGRSRKGNKGKVRAYKPVLHIIHQSMAVWACGDEGQWAVQRTVGTLSTAAS
jgi:hypothetical protein